MDIPEEEQSNRMAEVLRLNLTEGKGIRAISRQTGLDRKTVRKLLGLARGKQKPKAVAERSSILAPYEDDIREALEACADIKAPAVLDRLRAKGYQGGITVVRDRLRKVRPRPKQEAFFTRSYEPGQMLQVDWADFGYAIPGCPRRVSAFVMAACYSRYLYLEFVLSQAMGSFLRCMERALRFFGGVALADIFDNMKTVVLSHTPQATVFNHRFLHYARSRGFGAVACNVKKANEKGRVERGWLGVSIGQDEDGRTVIGSIDEESPAESGAPRRGPAPGRVLTDECGRSLPADAFS